jgi:isoquinoline 1-oxidoreductase subunit beta
MNLLSPTPEITSGEREAAIFFRECFIDELARAAWRDPVQYRREMLPEGSRLRRVLDEAARVSGWSRTPPEGHARGVALSVNRGAVAAHVAEMSVDEHGASQVHRIVAVIDCGAVAPAEVQAGWAAAGLRPAMANALAVLNLRFDQERLPA